MGCSSSKLHPLGYEKYDLLDENVEQKKGFHSSFHEEFDIGLCQTNAPIVTFVESVSCCSRSISCDSEETMSATTPTIEQSRPSQSSFKLQDDFELSETGANAPVDDESDLKEWLREIEETICTNPNQNQQLRHINQGEWDLMTGAQMTKELNNSFYKKTTIGDEMQSAESDYRNNTSTPCHPKELCSDDLTPFITTKYQEHKEIVAEMSTNDSRSVASCPS